MKNQIQTTIDYEQFKELATNTMRDIMTPAQKIRAKAERVSKDLVRAYEVGATMKDLDSVASMWTGIVEKALLEVPELVKPKPDVQAAIELRDRAAQVALNFAGQRISSSDGSYELLIELIHEAITEAVSEATGDKRSSWDHDRDCQCSECGPRS